MANQYVNKVIVNNEIKIDLTEDTITPKTLRKGFTAHDASGAPIVGNESLTDISEDGTNAGPILELTANGWAEQTQLSGKNLLPSIAINWTKNGITYTVNADGSITVNGTATDTCVYQIIASNTLSLAAGTYTLSGCPTNGSSSTYRLDVNAGGWYQDFGNSVSFTLSSETDVEALRIVIYTGVTVNNLTFYPQLELGSEATEYEPYCGGIPSPNPNYPQEIRVARGRNLLDTSGLSSPYLQRNEDGTIAVTSQPSSASNFGIVAFNFKAGVTYTLSGGFNGGAYLYVSIDGTSKASNPNSSTFTPSQDQTASIRVTIQPNTPVGTVFYPQLELGSYATPYVPYGFVGVEAQGRNLMPNIPSSYTSGATFVNFGRAVDFNGVYLSFYFSGSFTYGGAAYMAFVREDGTTSAVTMGYMRLASNNTAPVAGTTYSHEKMTFVSSSVYGEYVELRLYTNPAFTNPKFEECVLNNSCNPIEYEPYYHKTIPVPLPERGWVGGLPDGTSDILKLNTAGKYEWESNTGMLDLVNLNWAYYPTGSGLAPYFNTIIDDNIIAYEGRFDSTVYPMLAEDFVIAKRTSVDLIDGCMTFDGNVNTGVLSQIRCKMTDIITVEDFMAALGDSSLLLYKAANPTTEQGYVPNWDNTLPEHCTIDIPELRDISVRYYLDTASVEPAQRYYERANAELNQVIDDASNDATLEALAAIAPIEGDISSANYSTGSYLIHNNQLYKVTTAIATGETISTNTNITSATIANELLDIDSDLLDFSELLEAAKAEYREKFQAIDSWQAAASQLIREDNGYYSNESITRMLAQRFDGKLYGYSEPKTTAVAITKTGANAGLANPTLGTATVAGSSAYRHLGPFQWFAAKGIVDSDGVPHVSTIKGIDSDADWNADTNNVWSLRPIQWYSIDSTGGTVIGSLSDTWHLGLKPNPQAYLPDGTLRPYMLAPRYALGFENGVGVSKSGLKGYGRDVSHNSLITKLDYAHTGYSGKTIYENWYDIFMSRMIYGTKDFQTIMQGCTAYTYQYHPSVAEQDTTRVILSNANAANLVVGSTMMMGNQATESTDRNNVNAYNIFDGLIIESITEYDANNKSIELATDTTFNTDPAYLFSTAPWYSGSCDTMDWDGSPTNPQSAKECAFFQGCELMTGVYEVLANIILKDEADARQIPYIVHSSRDDATSVTANFVKCGDGLLSNDGTVTAWKYPLYIADHNGLLYGEEVGGSTIAGCTDGQYVRPDSVASDSEWLSVGHLGHGRLAGLSYVNASYGLGSADWSIWSRLSPVGLSRGES